MIEARMNALIAQYSSINPRTSATILIIDVSIPSVRESPSIKWRPALLSRSNKPLRASTKKRITAPNTCPSHSKKLSTCIV
ncbi:hypothetical protein D3C80_1941410 [compost metagenome]